MAVVRRQGKRLNDRLTRSPWEWRDKDARNNDNNRTVWWDDAPTPYDDEALEAANRRFVEENEAALEQVLADGYIPFPVFHRNLEGELEEFSAWLHPAFEPSCTEGFFERHGMSTNIYVPSYERAGVAPTPKLLDRFGVKNYYLCVDPSQYLKYKEHYPPERLVMRDINFRKATVQEPLSGLKRPMHMAGHAPLCNFTLALSRSLGEEAFTFSDDDIHGFGLKAHIPNREFKNKEEKYDKNNFYRCSAVKEEYGFNFQEFWHRLEVLTVRSRNPGFVGLEKFGSVFNMPVCFRRGTRVYTFYLTKNSTQMEHLGWQNNDVITSLEHSKWGQVNLLLEGLGYTSAPTQGDTGGQSEMYSLYGVGDKARQLIRAHPDHASMVPKYSRIHHFVDFHPYNTLRLVGAVIPEGEA